MLPYMSALLSQTPPLTPPAQGPWWRHFSPGAWFLSTPNTLSFSLPSLGPWVHKHSGGFCSGLQDEMISHPPQPPCALPPPDPCPVQFHRGTIELWGPGTSLLHLSCVVTVSEWSLDGCCRFGSLSCLTTLTPDCSTDMPLCFLFCVL